MITFHTQTISFSLPQKNAVKKWLKAVAGVEGKRVGEVAFIFCSDEELLFVNRKYLQHDYYTDVITFDYCEGDTLAGDVFVSIDTVRANAGEYRQTFGDELHRVILHGVLHLCGHGDGNAREQKQMRALEDFYLNMRW
jgi:rRNA maturation RNase YbeY